jgi:hypothetical protein
VYRHEVTPLRIDPAGPDPMRRGLLRSGKIFDFLQNHGSFFRESGLL